MTLSIEDTIKVQYNQSGEIVRIYDYENGSWIVEDFDSEKIAQKSGESVIITEYDDGQLKRIEIYSPTGTLPNDPDPSVQGVMLIRSSRTKYEGDDERDIITGTQYRDDIYLFGGNDVGYGGSSNDRLYGYAGHDRLFGQANDDSLKGSSGKDLLDGGSGIDRLSGGKDADRFQFSTAASATKVNRDLITDFSRSSGDKLVFRKSIYSGFGTSTALASAQFRSGSGLIKAKTTSQRFIYDTSTGILRFDRDGSGGSYAPLQVAQLGSSTTHPTLAYTDFQLK